MSTKTTKPAKKVKPLLTVKKPNSIKPIAIKPTPNRIEERDYEERDDREYDSSDEFLYGGFTDDWEDYYDSVYN